MIPIRGLRAPVVEPSAQKRAVGPSHRVVSKPNGRWGTTWTGAEEDELRRLWAEGLSASAIADALGPKRSRNAVLGKAGRLGLDERVSPIPRRRSTGAQTK